MPTSISNVAGVVEAAGSGSIISALGLRLQGTGLFTLTEANLVGTLAAAITGSMTFTDANGLIIGSVLGTPGITTIVGASGGNVRVNAGSTV